MRESRRRKILRTAQPLMQPGERAEIIAMAKVGTMPIKENVAAFAVSAAVSAVTSATLGVGVIMAFAPSETYMLLTDRQLLFFAANRQTGAPGRHRGSVPRAAITPTVLKDGLFVDVRLDIDASDKAVRLKFPPLPPSSKKIGRQLITALEHSAPTARRS
jgi:hypothetical protein